jgi:hypothetical protein
MLETKREGYKEDLNAGNKECEIQRVLIEESSMLQKSENAGEKKIPKVGDTDREPPQETSRRYGHRNYI